MDGAWRVVGPKGALVPVRVWTEARDCGCKHSPTWVQVDGGTTYGVNRDGAATERDIRRKIGEVYPCAEIRAPGEMTTAEAIAAAAPRWCPCPRCCVSVWMAPGGPCPSHTLTTGEVCHANGGPLRPAAVFFAPQPEGTGMEALDEAARRIVESSVADGGSGRMGA